MKDFKTKRKNILNVFQQAKTDLETLNADIQEQIDVNKQQITALSNVNSELAALKIANKSSIKTLGKFFK